MARRLPDAVVDVLKNHHETLNRAGAFLRIAFGAPVGVSLQQLAEDSIQDNMAGMTSGRLNTVFSRAIKAANSKPANGWTADTKLACELSMLNSRVTEALSLD